MPGHRHFRHNLLKFVDLTLGLRFGAALLCSCVPACGEPANRRCSQARCCCAVGFLSLLNFMLLLTGAAFLSAPCCLRRLPSCPVGHRVQRADRLGCTRQTP